MKKVIKKVSKPTIKNKKPRPKIDVTVNVTVDGKDLKKTATKTKIALVVDRSYSMNEVREAAYQGINEQIDTIRRNADKNEDTEVLYIQFNDTVQTVFKKPAKKLTDISRSQYHPSGNTALRDAVWEAINSINNGSEDKETAYLVIVISDGEENASKYITDHQLANRIQELQNTDQWTFTYMMSNIDLSRFRFKYHAYVNNSIPWTNTYDGTRRAFNCMALNTSMYMKSRSSHVGTSYSTTGFYEPNNATITVKNPSNVTITTNAKS